jgi:serine/threonine protein phosphatase PrpC
MIGLGDVVPFACSLSSDHVQYACCAPHSNMTSKTGLSVDHSFGAFGKSRLYKSRSAVISEWTIKITPKINSFKPSEFDYFVVMSDGVHKKIEPQNIGAILRTEVGKEAEFLCKQAILSPYNTDFQDHASAIVLNKKRFFQDLDSTETSLKSSSDSDMVGMPRSPIARRQSVLSVADIAAGGSAFGSVSGAAASTDRLLEAHQYLAAKITDPRKIANLYAEDCGADKKFSKSGLSVWSMEGFDASGRSYLNEDAVDFLEKDGWTALAVYDGHAGGRAISDALAGVNKMHSGRLLDDLIEAAKTQELTEDTCLEVFKRFDDRMLDLENGSTAAVILFNQSLIKGYMIVLGDSQPVAIYSNGELKTLEPHDPPAAGSELAEAKWPLDHAFGNFDYKEWQDCKECSMKIEPKVQKFNPAGVEYFVVASDGVYEHQRVALAETRSILNSAPEGREAELLCKTAAMNAFKNSLPHDDVSAIVLKMS